MSHNKRAKGSGPAGPLPTDRADQEAESLLVSSFRELPWERKVTVLKLACACAAVTRTRESYPRLAET